MLEQQGVYSENQAITGATAVASQNSVNHGTLTPGTENELIEVFCKIAGAGATGFTFAVQDSADDSTFADLVVSKAIPVANVIAQKEPIFKFVMPAQRRQYTRVLITPTGTATAGTFTITRRPI